MVERRIEGQHPHTRAGAAEVLHSIVFSMPWN